MLAAQVADLPATSESLRVLAADPALAWQTFALALLATALTDDNSMSD